MIVTSLIVLASASAAVFLLAFAVIRYVGPRHAFWLEVGALAGFGLSAVIWLIVAVATPAPMAVGGAAKLGGRPVPYPLPAEIPGGPAGRKTVELTGNLWVRGRGLV